MYNCRLINYVYVRQVFDPLEQTDITIAEFTAISDTVHNIPIVNSTINKTPAEILHMTSKMMDDKIRLLTKRLVPFAGSIPGSTSFFELHRKKLLAMLTSNTINQHANWRWFVTFAPADVYESRLYDVITTPTKELNCLRTNCIIREKLLHIEDKDLQDISILFQVNKQVSERYLFFELL